MQNETQTTPPTPKLDPQKKKMIAVGAGVLTVIIIAIVVALAVASGNAKNNQNPQSQDQNQQPNDDRSNEGQSNMLSNLPENMCPQSVHEDNGMLLADLDGKPYIVKADQVGWIEQNCENVNGLNSGSNGSNQGSNSQETEPPLLIGSLGFNLSAYNSATGKAGDITFTKTKLQFDQIYSPFGQQDPRSPNDPSKRNPQPTVILPLGTKVQAIATGEVVEVKELYSGDMTVWIAKSKQSQYFYEIEHIINPTVAVGDKVTAGQIIGEVSNYDSHNNPGFGLVEIGILHSLPDGSPPKHVCPLNYLDPSIKQKVFDDLTTLYSAWNAYLGKEVYKPSTFANPGCVVLDEVEG